MSGRSAGPPIPSEPWARVVELGLTLPEVEESTYYGYPALKVRGKFIAGCKDGVNLVLPIDRQSRDLLLSAEPELFHLTEHYRESAAVLVRLAVVGRDRLLGLLEDSWRSAAPKDLVRRLDD